MSRDNNHSSRDVFEVEIRNMKEDIDELKTEAKEDRKLFAESIQTMSENLVRLTTLSEQQSRRQDEQDEKLNDVHANINDLREDINRSNTLHTEWYQQFIDGKFGLVIKTLIIIVLVLLGAKLMGIDVTKLLGQ